VLSPSFTGLPCRGTGVSRERLRARAPTSCRPPSDDLCFGVSSFGERSLVGCEDSYTMP